jgi:hypothetical protein
MLRVIAFLFLLSHLAEAAGTAVLRQGSKTITLATTPECLSADTSLVSQSVIVIAKSGNAASIVVGGPDLSDGGAGITLSAGIGVGIEGPSVNAVDLGLKLSEICVDVGTNGDGVDFVYME